MIRLYEKNFNLKKKKEIPLRAGYKRIPYYWKNNQLAHVPRNVALYNFKASVKHKVINKERINVDLKGAKKNILPDVVWQFQTMILFNGQVLDIQTCALLSSKKISS